MIWLENLPDDWWNQYKFISLSPQCIQQLNIELLFLVRSLILETRTYARVCKRVLLLSNDFQNALDARNIHLSVHSTVNVRQSKETVISVSSLIDQTPDLSSKINRLQLTIHWLAIDGEQPIISENPSPTFDEENVFYKKPQDTEEKTMISSSLTDKSSSLQKLFEIASLTKIRSYQLQHHVHPLTMNNLIVKPNHPRNPPVRRSHTNHNIPSSSHPAQPCLAHELSTEQQIYFKMLTETCFNGTDKQRNDAFRCLSSDAALQPLLPRLLLFISEGIQTNIHLHDLCFINRFLSILNMLTMNRFVSFDKYLHLIVPSLLTCLVCIFDMPKNANLLSNIDKNSSQSYSTIWILRKQASDLIFYFEKKYSIIPYFTERIVSILKSNLINNNNTDHTFSIVYTCIRTLLLIDIKLYGSFVINIIQKYETIKVLEPDFDLNYIEQQTLFDQNIAELSRKYNLELMKTLSDKIEN